MCLFIFKYYYLKKSRHLVLKMKILWKDLQEDFKCFWSGNHKLFFHQVVQRLWILINFKILILYFKNDLYSPFNVQCWVNSKLLKLNSFFLFFFLEFFFFTFILFLFLTELFIDKAYLIILKFLSFYPTTTATKFHHFLS